MDDAPPGALWHAISDPSGDATGGTGSRPDIVDLVRVAIDVDAEGTTIEWTLAAAPPATRTHRQLNLVFFRDDELDGITDHEVWATLDHTGWVPTHYVRADSGFMALGSAVGITIEADGTTIRAVVPAAVLPTDDDFLWVAAAEDGKPSDYGNGSTWTDAVPDAPDVVRWRTPS